MAAFGSSEGSNQGAGLAAAGADASTMEWDLDVDAFLDDYLKELGPEAPGLDHFGNIQIDFAPSVAQPGILGAWGPSAPATSLPADSTAHGAPTMLTSQLQAHGLHSQGHTQEAAGSEGAAQTSGEQQQQQQQQQKAAAVPQPPSTRSTRARKSAAGAAAASAAAAAAAGGGPSASRATSAGPSRGTRETKKETDLKKHLALQEKNRRAQRRFRERQKQRVAELEEQVATLQAQLELAASAKGAAPAPAAGSSGQEGPSKDAHASPRAVVCTQVPSSGSQPGSDEEGIVPAVRFDDALTLTVREGSPVTLTARQLADMTPAELAKYYKAYVNELAGILVESDNPASHGTQDRVRRLVDEVCLLSTRAALCNPPASKHFSLAKVDEVPGQPADARVPQIARALDISQTQRKQLGQLRGLFLQKLARIAGDRRELNAQLAGAVPGGTGNRHLCSRYLAAHDCARRLRESLREEHILVLDFVSTIFKHVFTSQQVAQFMIQSYPWTPDCLALCTWVAAEDGDAEALSMLAADAQSKQAAAAAAAAAAAVAGGASGVTQAPPGPQASTGASVGSGSAAAGPGLAVHTPGMVPGMGMHGSGAGTPMFLPTAFAPAGMQGGSAAVFGQPVVVSAGGQGMVAGFNPAAALMHAPGGGDHSMGGMVLMGQRWVAAPAPAHSAGHQPMTAAGSGCLHMPAGLPHLSAGMPSLQIGEIGGASTSASVPISPHVVTMSSMNAEAV